MKNIWAEKYQKLLKLLPRSEEYVDNIEILPMITDMSRLSYLTAQLGRPMPDLKELPLILDIDNLLESIRAQPTNVLETKYTWQQLKEEFYQYRI